VRAAGLRDPFAEGDLPVRPGRLVPIEHVPNAPQGRHREPVGAEPRLVYAPPIFEPKFVEHRGARILRLEFSHLSGPDLVAAADQVRRVVAAEPLRSVRILSILNSRLTAEGAGALKQCSLANGPHVRAAAAVATNS